jgi:2-dehydropantoate 2-reductase
MVGKERTIGALVNWGADYIAPGHILFGKDGHMYIGELDGTLSPRIKELQRVFSSFITVRITSNIFGYLWSKQILSTMLFATALADLPIYEVLEAPEARPLMGDLVREAMLVPAALGISLEEFKNEFSPSLFQQGRDDEALNLMGNQFRGVIKNKTGMWRDIAIRKRPTEVDGLIGEIVRKGESLGLSLPLNRCLIKLIHELEQGQRSMSLENFREFTR